MKAHIRLLASTDAPSHRLCRRRAVLAVSVAALLLPFFGVDDVHAATLDLNGVNITLPNAPDFTTSYLSGASNVTDFGASATLFEGGGPAAPIAYTGTISDGSGVVSLVHTGGTTIIHGTANNYSGGTTIEGGLISFNNGGALGVSNVTLEGGALLSTANLTLANTVIVSAGTEDTVSAAAGTTLTLSALNLDGNSDAVLGSAGQTGVVVIGANGSSGTVSSSAAIDVAFGTLRNGGALGFVTASIASTTVHAGATLDVHDSSMEVANLLGAGTVTLGTSAATTLTVDAGSFGGVISGAGQLSKTTAGTLILTGANTFTGGSFIFSGTLQIGNGGTTGSITGLVTDKETLTFDHSNALTFGGIIIGTGGVTQAGTGVLTLTGVNTYSGGTTVNAGVVSINNASALGSGNVILNNGSGLLTTANLTLANPVAFNPGETGDVAAASGTTLTLDALQLTGNAVFGSAGHTGVVAIAPTTSGFSVGTSGTSIEVAFGNLRNGGGLGYYASNVVSTTVDAGATLDVHDFSMEVLNLQGAGAVTLGTNAATVLTVDAGTFSGVISGAGELSKTTAGTLTLTGANTYTGSTIVVTGTLQIGNGGTTGSITGNVTDKETLTFDHSNAVTFGGTIIGTGGVTQAGTGVLTLTGVNTYSGNTTVNAGVVSINKASALGSGSVTLNNGSGLLTTANLALANPVIFNAGETGVVAAAPGTTLTLDAVQLFGHAVFGSAGHTGVVTLGPINAGSFFGTTSNTSIEVAFGTLRNDDTSFNFYGGGASTTVDAGATLDVHDFNAEIANLQGAGAITLGTNANTIFTVDAGTFSGAISGAGQLTSTGTLTLSGTNTYTGGTTISAGTLQIGNGGNTGSIAGNIVDNGSLIVGRSTALTIAGNISGSGTLTQAGSGVLTLTGLNTYAGGTTITAGVVSFNSGSPFGTGTVTLNHAGSLLATANVTLGNEVLFNTSVSGTVSAATGSTLTLVFLGIGDVDAVQGIFGSPGHTGVVNIAPGSTELNTGSSIVVAFGTLRNGGALGLFTDALSSTTVDAGATMDVHDEGMTVTNLQGAGTVTLGKSAATILTVDAGNFSGVISGAGQLTQATTGTLILSGTNTYTGSTAISGTLQLGNGGTTGSITGNVTDNGNLIFDRNNALTFAGKISGSGSVTQNGTGLLTLTGMNTYSGGTTVNAGLVGFSNFSTLGPGSITLNNSGGLLGTTNVSVVNTLEINSGETGVIAATPGTALTFRTLDLVGDAVFGHAGDTGVVVADPLGAGSSDPGATIDVAFGTLRNGAAGSNGLSFFTSAVASTTVNAGATMDVHDLSMEVAKLQGAGAVTLGTNASTVLTLDAGVFSGVISGAGQLDKLGPSTVLFIGTNTYTGGTTITAGTLQLGVGGTTGSIVGNIADNASVTFAHSNAVTFAGVISGTGTVAQNGPGVLTLTGANTYSGGTFINAGEFSVNNAAALGTGGIALGNGVTLLATANLGLTQTVTIAGNTTATISATTGSTLTLGSLDLFGAAVFGSAGHTGTVVIGPNTNSLSISPPATIDVAFGTLRNGAATDNGLSFLTDDAVSTTVNAGAVLDAHDFSMEVANLLGGGTVTLGTSAATVLTVDAGNFSGVISGAGQLTKSTAGTLVLTGTNTYTGGTTISAGTLQLGNGGITGSIVGNVADNGNLTFDRSNAVTSAGKISGTGTLSQNGSGVLTLTGTNTYTGGTTVNGGTLSINNAAALGTGGIALGNGVTLLATANLGLTQTVSIAANTTATFAATTGSTLTLGSLDVFGAAVFGSAGHTGAVVIGPNTNSFSISPPATIDVAFGTLRNGAATDNGLSFFTDDAVSTTVNAGAALDVHDFSMEVANLQGAGAVTLGTSAATVLTLDTGAFGGVISGAGQVTKATSGTLTLTKASTYTGGTTINGGRLVVSNTSGSATGTGPVTINSGVTLGGSGTVGGAMTLNSNGLIAPGTASAGTPGTKLHGSSLIWNGGGTLALQLGSTSDELILSGALTKGTAGTFSLVLTDEVFTATTYTLATFASTNFTLSDFTLSFPEGGGGVLSETATSLVLTMAHNDEPTGDAGSAPAPLSGSSDDARTETLSSFSSSSDSQDTTILNVTPTPEPGSASLLLLGGTALLGWRRRRRTR